MGVALTELGLVPLDATRREIETARELDVLVTAHTGTVADPRWPREVSILYEQGLLDAGQVHVHCNSCSDGELRLIADAGATVSVTPETEMQMGMGFPVTGRALDHGLRPGFGCDIVSLGSGDLLTQMRMGLQMQRAIDNEASIGREQVPERLSLGVRDVLELATVDGAAALGLASEVGTLAPGKAADMIMLRTDGLNFAPRADPASAVVLHARAADVDTVLVGGRIVKRGGSLLGADTARAHRLAEESRDRVISAAERKGGLLPELPEGRRRARGRDRQRLGLAESHRGATRSSGGVYSCLSAPPAETGYQSRQEAHLRARSPLWGWARGASRNDPHSGQL